MELVKLNKARQALIEAKSLDEILEIRNVAVAGKAWLEAAMMGPEMVNDAQEIKIRAERKAGEFLKTMPKNIGGVTVGDTTTSNVLTLDDLGVHRMQSSRWQKMSSVDDEKFENFVLDKREKKEEVTSAGVIALADGRAVVQFSGEYEWYTPEKYIELVREVMGSIDLDPASSDRAQETVRADSYYTKEMSGLTHGWGGNVFINPPYCMPEIDLFATKLLTCILGLEIQQAIFLSNNSTDTVWWQALFKECKCVCFTKGRIKFYGEEANAMPLRGQTFFYFGSNKDKFISVFSEVGVIGISQ